MIRSFLLFTVLLASLKISAQYNAAEVYHDIQKLKVLGSVLYVAAHPDDENTRLLAYLAKERQFRTGYLSLTRGDGGQNLIGDEQGIDLGLIRTQELLAARSIDGAEQFFSRAYDFGYSKSTEEALSKWNEQNVLADAVWVIRKFQPDVIITRFPEDQRAGHGQHSASAVIAHKAFIAAADSTMFPEQFKYGVRPWKARRLFWNTFNFGNTNTTSADQLKMDVGGYNSVLGYSYGELSAESRSQHKSQGFGVPSGRGETFEFFTQLEGDKATNDIMEGIDVTWKRVTSIEFNKEIDHLLNAFSIARTSASLPGLISVYKKISSLQPGYWRTQKLKELTGLIQKAAGLWLEGSASSEYAIQGDSIRVTLTVNNRSGSNLKINSISLGQFDTTINKSLESNRNFVLTALLPIPDTMPVSHPYWLVERMQDASFVVKNQELIGRPWNEPAFTALFNIAIEGEPFSFMKAVDYKYTDPVRGEVHQPLVVVPAVTVSTDPSILVFRKGVPMEQNMVVNLHANKNIVGYKASIQTRIGSRQFTSIDSSFNLTSGAERNYPFKLRSDVVREFEQSQVQAFATLQNGEEGKPAYLSLTSIRYDHIPRIHYFFPDGLRVLNIDLKTSGKKIGYIEGAGDRVHIALQQMGYEVTILKEQDLTASNLVQFDAIMTGVRAYNVHSFLQAKYEVLMDYVAKGGNLIVQYNTNSQIGPVKARIGPQPFNISRGRITDETSPVQFAIPGHPVLNFPNKITQEDFEGWVQERGIYFADQFDAKFKAPLLMNDPNEQPLSGGLIITDHGKGKFVYTGLVFFRELPAGVPGAYRLLANIIALNKKAAF